MHARKSYSHPGGFSLFHSVNVKLAKSEQKMLLSGMHTISNITCKGCDTPLGWVYLRANDPAQRYKEGMLFFFEEDERSY